MGLFWRARVCVWRKTLPSVEALGNPGTRAVAAAGIVGETTTFVPALDPAEDSSPAPRNNAIPGTQAALLFPSGFQANASVMACVAGSPGVDVFSDELNHASLIDGVRLAKSAGARVHVYRHCDVDHLESLLAACAPGAPVCACGGQQRGGARF